MSDLAKTIKIPKNPYLLFSPFLLLYIIIVILFQTNTIWGDEARYYSHAQNLLHGFYSPPPPDISFRNGPGYPLLMAPFLALQLPLICIKLLNAIFHYLSIIFLFKTLKQFVSFKTTVIFSFFWACYYNAYEALPSMFTEIFTTFLISAAMLSLTRVFRSGSFKKEVKNIFLSGFILGYLALTKVVFGYVLLVLLIACGIFWIINKNAANYRKITLVIVIAFITTAPYLIYTYNLTGKIFYWATSSGSNLYWMTSLNEEEYGSWFADPRFESDTVLLKNKNSSFAGGELNLKNRNNKIAGIEDSIRLYHQKDFEEINKYTGVERDDAFKRIAFKNIRTHPGKYLKNCVSNIGRMLFNYPFSYSLQKPGTLLRLPLNGIIVVLMMLCSIPTLINWKKIPFFIRVMLFFAFVYLGGSILECAEIRMFTMVVPILLLWVAFILKKIIKINLKFVDDSVRI